MYLEKDHIDKTRNTMPDICGNIPAFKQKRNFVLKGSAKAIAPIYAQVLENACFRKKKILTVKKATRKRMMIYTTSYTGIPVTTLKLETMMGNKGGCLISMSGYPSAA
jgi:hypothetical protein